MIWLFLCRCSLHNLVPIKGCFAPKCWPKSIWKLQRNSCVWWNFDWFWSAFRGIATKCWSKYTTVDTCLRKTTKKYLKFPSCRFCVSVTKNWIQISKQRRDVQIKQKFYFTHIFPLFLFVCQRLNTQTYKSMKIFGECVQSYAFLRGGGGRGVDSS